MHSTMYIFIRCMLTFEIPKCQQRFLIAKLIDVENN